MSHMAESEHELTRMPSQSSYISLLASDGARDDAHDGSKSRPNDPPPNNSSKFSSALRHLRLQFIIPIFAKLRGLKWNAAVEHRKTAIYKSRTIAAAHSLSHLVPFTGAVILLIFQWTGYWIGGEDDYSTSLQFAAKFHELAMQASIVEVLLCLVRTSLIDSMVPLGALSCTIQATQLSYLWSLDFFSLFRSHTFQRWQRVVFLVAIPALISLTSLVGPSSAILMIPRPNSPRIGHTRIGYSNETVESLYPSQMGVSEGLIIDIEQYETNLQYSDSGPAYVESDGSKSRLFRDPSDYSSRVLQSSYFGSSKDDDEGRGVSNAIATIPTVYITYALGDLHWSGGLLNGTTTVTAAHPIVGVQCTHRTRSVNASSKLKYWKDDWISIGELPSVGTMIAEVSDHVALARNRSVVYLSPVWTQSPELGSTSSVAVFFIGRISGGWNGSTQALLAQFLAQKETTNHVVDLYASTCTMSSYWSTGEMLLIRKDDFREIDTIQTPRLSAHKKSDARSITLNFTLANTFLTGKFHLALNPGYEDSDTLSRSGVRGPTLAQVLAVTLASWPKVPNITVEMLSREVSLRPNSTAFSFSRMYYGYGYGTRSISIYLSMTVLTVYCAITASYMLYTLITGSASTAWNSGIELFALALQSKKPYHLGHTSVGIDSIKTFSEGVGVRVNAENELEIVFANDRDIGTRGLTKIVRNRAY